MAKKRATKKRKQKTDSKFAPKNQEQISAIEAMLSFIENGDPDEYFNLSGKAGTGKTTIIQEAIAPYVKTKTVVVAALSHKAKMVLYRKLAVRFGRSVEAETIASLLGMKLDMETGKFVIAKRSGVDRPIEMADILVVDECSMINDMALDLIMKNKKKNCKVLFVGDIGQLPPIRDEKSAKQDLPSLTFATTNRAILRERVRQGEESPILPYADLYWDNSQSKSPVFDPVNRANRKSIVTEFGSLVFVKSRSVIDVAVSLFREAVEKNDPDIIRFVVYRNKARMVINNRVRKGLFGEMSEQEFAKGEIIVFDDNFSVGNTLIQNSTECQVKTAEYIDDGEWKYWKIDTVINGVQISFNVLQEKDKYLFSQHLQKLADYANSLSGPARTNAWREFRDQKEMFAPVEYAYAITSHKSQGSTYDVCIVAEKDIVDVTATSNKSKSQSIYTSITRAKYLAMIMDGESDDPNALDEAIGILKKQRSK